MTELAVTARPLAVIEAELDLLELDARQKETALVANYIEVGRRLEEVKTQLAHGEWGPWLESRGYPQAKAVKFMRVFRAYGSSKVFSAARQNRKRLTIWVFRNWYSFWPSRTRASGSSSYQTTT